MYDYPESDGSHYNVYHIEEVMSTFSLVGLNNVNYVGKVKNDDGHWLKLSKDTLAKCCNETATQGYVLYPDDEYQSKKIKGIYK